MQDIMREIGSEYDLESNNNYIELDINQSFFKKAELFRSGRDALKAIAFRYKSLYNRIVLPALCCESMVTPFIRNGYDVVFFKLNPDISANAEDILSRLQHKDIFLYMNYFGVQSLSDEVLQQIKKIFPKTIMIEDKTHDILSPRCNEFIPDYMVCSIRKWLAISDGGVLYTQGDTGYICKEYDPFFSDIRTNALRNKSDYLKSQNMNLKDLFRSQFEEANEYLDKDKSIVGMSSKSYELLKRINFSKIAEVRFENIRILCQELKDIDQIKKIHSINANKIALYYPIIVDSRNDVQQELANNGIYCPVIWPLPKKAVGICEVSDYISSNMLALPCDQRYVAIDMVHISTILKRIFGA